MDKEIDTPFKKIKLEPWICFPINYHEQSVGAKVFDLLLKRSVFIVSMLSHTSFLLDWNI